MHFRFPYFIILAFACVFLCNCVWETADDIENYLPLDDSSYPYANIPRFVIETEHFAQILDKETKINANLQIYGPKEPISGLMELTIKGRGNSSFEMTKFGYKLKFIDKQSLFGMPKSREWDLVPNFRDKSHLRNHITYQLASILEDEYVPRNHFVELYINREYKGLFLLVEHIKVAKNRVNIPENDSSFLFEKTSPTSTDGTMLTSSMGYIFKFCSPKEPSQESASLLENHINDFERFLETEDIYKLDSIRSWIDVEDFVRYYWIQEFSKNLDGGFHRSIFFTWKKGDVIKMGPVWDFDLGYGLNSYHKIPVEGWHVRIFGWHRYLFKNEDYRELIRNYWIENHRFFEDVLDSIESAKTRIAEAANNDFKRWRILQNDTDWPFIESYDSYEEAVDTLKSWIERRIQWIDENL